MPDPVANDGGGSPADLLRATGLSLSNSIALFEPFDKVGMRRALSPMQAFGIEA